MNTYTTALDDSKFYVGPEVFHTPAESKKTLFVVGCQPLATIQKLMISHNVTHVSLGANNSFTLLNPAQSWDKTVSELISSGVAVTLEYGAEDHAAMLSTLSTDVWRSRNFIPLVRVNLPSFNTTNTNLTIKIDDSSFGATNPGVWTLHHTQLTDSNRFTDWSETLQATAVSVLLPIAKPAYVAPVPAKPAVPAKQEVIPPTPAETLNDTHLGLDETGSTAMEASAGNVGIEVFDKTVADPSGGEVINTDPTVTEVVEVAEIAAPPVTPIVEQTAKPAFKKAPGPLAAKHPTNKPVGKQIGTPATKK